VFFDSCPAAIQISDPTTINDVVAGVNAVMAITHCNGAAEPQGGHPFDTAAVQCAGQQSLPCNTAASPPANTFDMANSLNTQNASEAYNGTFSNMAAFNGCAAYSSWKIQNRNSGFGTRITFCFNINAGSDCSGSNEAPCLANTANGTPAGCVDTLGGDNSASDCGNPVTTFCPGGVAPTTGVMLHAVCTWSGNNGAANAPLDPQGTIGYASRSTWNNPSAASQLTNCGLIGFNNATSWNGQCDPYALQISNAGGAAYTPPAGTATVDSQDGKLQCDGDMAVIKGDYPIWGFIHLVLNAQALQSGNDAEAEDYITFLTSEEEDMTLPDYGFLRQCQLQYTRSDDAAPFNATTPNC
jgi:hypothetical protein